MFRNMDTRQRLLPRVRTLCSIWVRFSPEVLHDLRTQRIAGVQKDLLDPYTEVDSCDPDHKVLERGA